MSPATQRFLDGVEGAASEAALLPELPLRLDVEAMTGERALDIVVFLALIGALYLGFRLLRDSGLPRLRPAVGTACVLAVVLYGALYEGFWNLAGVDVDDAGVTMRVHVGGDVRLAWSEVAAVDFDRGDLLPVFMDDARLVLRDAEDDRRVAIPRFLPGAGDAARWVDRLAPKPPASPQETGR